jgi:hypothetical protein
MNRLLLPFFVLFHATASAEEPHVTDIKAVFRNGQTFITWKDVAEREEGAKFRYSVYRSDKPIGADLGGAELLMSGVLNNSAKLFGSAFNMKDRLDPAKPYSVIEQGGKPLPPWSGLAVVTVRKPGNSYYAVVATDEKRNPVSKVVAGKSATTEAVEEKPGPIQPIKIYDSKERKSYVAQTSITGKKGLPLHVTLHGSSSQGGGASEWGDYYLYFGTREMGYRDGMPGVFSVEEHKSKEGNRLVLKPRDNIEHPAVRPMESYWFGYWCVPQWADHKEPRVYPFTERRVMWMTEWAVKHYDADPNRVTMGGSSSGGVGSNNVGFRHPEMFAAVYPSVGRVRKVPAVAFEGKLERGAPALMHDGKTSYHDHVDGPKFAAEHHEDLPFLGWACGRRDGWATWQEHIDMVKAMTESKHGFAFSWNNGNHGEGGKAMQAISKYYPATKFALRQSYPALGNSSLNEKMGNGDPADGDLVGGINLGFDWKDVIDEQGKWSVTLSNELAKADMTVDVTPRRCQKFRLKPDDKVTWTASTGETGSVTADKWGLVTVATVVIKPGKATTLTIQSRRE